MLELQKFTFNPYQENTYVLFDETGECAIIDPGMYGGEEQDLFVNFINSNGLKPVLLLNTHAHIDHVLGNRFVHDMWSLKPQMHEDELPFLHAVISYAPQMGFNYEPSPEPEIFLTEESPINFGKSSLRALFTPGHSAAHLCFYAEEENFIIGGDVLFYNSIGRTDLPGGNYDLLIHSIRTKLWALPDNCEVYPGHGPKTSIGFEKSTNPFLKEG
ncbi:MAG: MBL fold metallo-hydrolase [Flavobacterium sp.]|nr:MAG: MBL fold metallo-hydrolase [Flavobacterium sp.]